MMPCRCSSGSGCRVTYAARTVELCRFRTFNRVVAGKMGQS